MPDSGVIFVAGVLLGAGLGVIIGLVFLIAIIGVKAHD